MRPYTLSPEAKRAQRAYTLARVFVVVLSILAFLGFEGMLLSLAHANMPLWFFVLACVSFGAGIMTAVYMHTFAVPRMEKRAFNARWECPSYVAYMAQFKTR